MGIDAINLALTLNDRDYRRSLDENKKGLTDLGNVKMTGTRSELKGTTMDLKALDAQSQKASVNFQNLGANIAKTASTGASIAQIVDVTNKLGKTGGAAGLANIFTKLGGGMRTLVSGFVAGASRIVAVLGPVGLAVGAVGIGLATFGPKIIPGVSLATTVLNKLKSMLGSVGTAISKIAGGVLSTFDTALTTLGKTIGALGTAAMGAVAAIAALGAAFVASQVKGLKLNMSLQEAKAQFEIFTGSAIKADAIISELQKRADITPFATADYVEGGSALMSAAEGSKDKLMELMKTAEMLTVLNPAEGLAGASVALKNALSGDFTSFQDRFNVAPATIQHFKAMGKTGNDLVRAVLESMNVTESSVAKLGSTLKGRMSTVLSFIDNIRQRLSAGLFQWLSEKMGFAVDWISKNQQWVLDTATGIGMKIVEIINKIIPYVKAAWEYVKVAIFTVMELIKTLGANLSQAFNSGRMLEVATQLIVAISKAIWDAMKLLGGLAKDGITVGVKSLAGTMIKFLIDKVRETFGERVSGWLGLGDASATLDAAADVQKQQYYADSAAKIKAFGQDAASRIGTAASNAGTFINEDLGLAAAHKKGAAKAKNYSVMGSIMSKTQDLRQMGAAARMKQEKDQAGVNWGPPVNQTPQDAAAMQAMNDPNWAQNMINGYLPGNKKKKRYQRPGEAENDAFQAQQKRQRVDVRVTSMDGTINPLSR